MSLFAKLELLSFFLNSYNKLLHLQFNNNSIGYSSLLLVIAEDSVSARWEGGDKEQSSVVSATDNERSVWLAMILLV